MDRNRATHACRMRCVWAHQVYVCVTEHNGRCACAIDMDVVDVVMFTWCRVSITCAYGMRDAIMACWAQVEWWTPRASPSSDTAKCEFSKRAGVQLVTISASGGNDGGGDGRSSDAPPTSAVTSNHVATHPNFPSLKMPADTVVYQHFNVMSDTLNEMGTAAGKFTALWQCSLVEADGRVSVIPAPPSRPARPLADALVKISRAPPCT